MIRHVALALLITIVGCKEKPAAKPESAEQRQLREYCASLKVGDPAPEVPAQFAQQGSKPNPSTVELLVGSKGTGTCHVTIDTSGQRISALRFQPD